MPSDRMLVPAAFLDKDGTLIEDVPYNVDPAKIRLAPGAAEALPALFDAGFELVVVSNQSGVARGMFAESALAVVERRIRELLSELGVPLAGFYYCPHYPEGQIKHYAITCSCRKPEPGMLHSAASQLGLDLSRSWLIGDILDDIEAGNRAGCRTILIDNGHETVWRWNPQRRPDAVVSDLAAGATAVLAASPIATRELEPVS